MIASPDVMRQLAEDRLGRRRREAREHRLARSPRPGRSHRLHAARVALAARLARRRGADAAPRPATT